jgi:hypothetical protein
MSPDRESDLKEEKSDQNAMSDGPADHLTPDIFMPDLGEEKKHGSDHNSNPNNRNNPNDLPLPAVALPVAMETSFKTDLLYDTHQNGVNGNGNGVHSPQTAISGSIELHAAQEQGSNEHVVHVSISAKLVIKDNTATNNLKQMNGTVNPVHLNGSAEPNQVYNGFASTPILNNSPIAADSNANIEPELSINAALVKPILTNGTANGHSPLLENGTKPSQGQQGA